MSLTIVTGNSHKCEEITYALQQRDIAAVCTSVHIDEIQSLDSDRVIMQKARDAYLQLQSPVLVDDGGFYIHAYNAFPGVFTKFVYNALGFDGLMRLVREGEPATFRAAVAYYDAVLADDGVDPVVFRGEYTGVITTDFERKENSEMPYALFFIPEGYNKPLAQLTRDERSGDHRQQAVGQFAEWYIHNRGVQI